MLGFWFVRWAVHFMRGGFALRILAPLWGRLWREHEYRADLYAAGLGEGRGLADFLATHALVEDYPIPFVWLSGHTHPPTELRIDRLRRVGV
jgi:Zn-dependent protease with chaperone function